VKTDGKPLLNLRDGNDLLGDNIRAICKTDGQLRVFKESMGMLVNAEEIRVMGNLLDRIKAERRRLFRDLKGVLAACTEKEFLSILQYFFEAIWQSIRQQDDLLALLREEYDARQLPMLDQRLQIGWWLEHPRADTNGKEG